MRKSFVVSRAVDCGYGKRAYILEGINLVTKRRLFFEEKNTSKWVVGIPGDLLFPQICANISR